MKLERLSEQNQKYYAAAKALYEEAFPVLERRDDLEQARIMKNPAYHFDFITDEDGFVDLPPESGCYFAQYETTWADGVTKRYCEPLEFDADACDWPQLTNHSRVIWWCENPVPPEVRIKSASPLSQISHIFSFSIPASSGRIMVFVTW